ncbi:hypothetical protein NC797_08970 [Aquibacillus sp. 3ASR75-11]|uniref:Uncharacterized protein n=1 Tax=Terrihalobacillus insolitus TaxID=2950438 RepID=A0A9X3WRX8_9BACI|nr:hypothetical protein [Terrihalobacillus insolitus]MDC3413603.1 hypothetical protein [Terrihalobacillus insolitus]MDC3424640.1 hypothetical protein [Terrihalobacillus insolitus]
MTVVLRQIDSLVGRFIRPYTIIIIVIVQFGGLFPSIEKVICIVSKNEE